MSLPALLRTSPDTDVSLGPATVVTVQPHGVEVRLMDGRTVLARFALALPYDATVGDTLLVIGNDGGHYVIGVLSGSGKTLLEIQGNVDLRAVGGELRLTGDRAVKIEAPEFEVRTGRWSTIADTMFQKVTALHQRVTELLSLHAGQTRSVVEGSAYAQARTATLLTEETVTVNGKAIHLG